MAVLVDLEKVSASRPDRPLFTDLSLTVADGDRVGVTGINGTGKSTLLRVVAGIDEPESGTVRRGRGVRTGYLDQRPDLPAGTVAAAVGTGWEAEAALERLGMGADAGTATDALSGGQAKRVALARVLCRPAELLVLDEPTNHLDLGAVSWLEERLRSWPGGLVLVSHDRYLLDRVTTRMVELDRGSSYVHEGGYADYLDARAERDERAAGAEAVRRNLAKRELAWLRRGAKARTRKSQARIDSAHRLIDARPEAPARTGDLDLGMGTPRLGDKVIEARDIVVSHDGAPPVLDGVELVLSRRDRVGLVGRNGTGKSTLLEVLAGRRTPDTGNVEVGPTVVVGYYDQQGVDIDPNARVRDLVAGPTRAPGGPEDTILMNRFWFGGELAYARPATLSGGERRRLQLLLVLAARPNVLLLDEPTNDLDLDTLRVLEDFVEDWPGALVVVSHDRVFLERTVERVVALDGSGHLAAVAGGVEAWARASSGASQAVHRPATAGRPTGNGSRGGDSRQADRRRPPAGVSQQLRATEKEVARLERRRDALHVELAGAGTDHRQLTRLGAELAEVAGALDTAEERWLELAAELEGA